jgi:hypothetical protein
MFVCRETENTGACFPSFLILRERQIEAMVECVLVADEQVEVTRLMFMFEVFVLGESFSNTFWGCV